VAAAFVEVVVLPGDLSLLAEVLLVLHRATHVFVVLVGPVGCLERSVAPPILVAFFAVEHLCVTLVHPAILEPNRRLDRKGQSEATLTKPVVKHPIVPLEAIVLGERIVGVKAASCAFIGHFDLRIHGS